MTNEQNTNSAPVAGIRLNKRMSELGLCSRREADTYIDKGIVTVDGVAAHHPGQRVLASQTIELHLDESDNERLTIALHKPVGYVSGTPEDDHEPALRLVRKENFQPSNAPAHAVNQAKTTDANTSSNSPWPSKPIESQPFPKSFRGLAPCGRLDINSEGLIIFSNDGRIAKTIIAPDNTIDKEYLIRFSGHCSEAQMEMLRHGIVIDNSPLKPAKVELINESQLRITLQEGKKRQIRHMCDAVRLSIVKLQRTRVGPITLAGLPLGKWRMISDDEIEALLQYQAPKIG